MTLVTAISHWLRTTRSRLTLLFGGTAVLTGLAIGFVADEVLSRHLTELSGQSLMNASQPIALALAQGMQEREREISLLSHLPMITRPEGYGPQLQAHLEQIRQSYPFYAWIGVTDEQGVVQVATGNLLLGQDVSQRPWFGAGKNGPYIGDAHDSVLPGKHPQKPDNAPPLRLMDYASPVRGQDSLFKGVISAQVNWAWVQDIIHRASPASVATSGLEVMLVNQDGVLNAAGAVELPPSSLSSLPVQGNFHVMSWGGAGRVRPLPDRRGAGAFAHRHRSGLAARGPSAPGHGIAAHQPPAQHCCCVAGVDDGDAGGPGVLGGTAFQ